MFTFHLADTKEGYIFLERFAQAVRCVPVNYDIEKIDGDKSYISVLENKRLNQQSSIKDIIQFLLRNM